MRRRPYATVVMLSLGLAACSGGGGGTEVGTPEAAPTGSMTYHGDAGSPAASSTSGSVGSPGSSAGESGVPSSAASSAAASTPAPGATSSVAMPDLPAAAKAHTPDGAAAFARYYLELVNYAWQKPDPAPLRAHALPTCTTCEGWAQDADAQVKARSRVDRPALDIRAVDPGDQLSTGEQTVIAVVHETAFRAVSADGVSSDKNPERTSPVSIIVKRSGAGWAIAAVEEVQR